MFRGDNKNQKFIVLIGGVPMDISTAALKFTVKKKDTDTTALFQRKNTNAGGGPSEIEMTDPVNGKFTVKVLPSNTSTLEGNVKYWYDIEMTLGGSVRTLIKNRILVNTDITT
jgi:hypothetical protein